MRNIFLTITLFAAVFVLVISDFGRHGTVVYDCGIAEWHPDIPNSVKEECRQMHKEEWERQQKSKKNVIST